MSSALDLIIAGVKEDLLVRKSQNPKISESSLGNRVPLDALNALTFNNFSIIAEVKRSSPSKGDLAAILDPANLAMEYESAGAAVISVLTEERRFKGSIDDFEKVRERVTIPMLRKDFIVDEYQVYESRSIGADLQLLIVAALDKVQLKDFYVLGAELGMNSLIEVHSLAELEMAMALNPKIIGVNSRNLKTLEVDFEIFKSIIPEIPKDILKVAESGISKREEVEILEKLGANAILVGETLVKAHSARAAITELLGR